MPRNAELADVRSSTGMALRQSRQSYSQRSSGNAVITTIAIVAALHFGSAVFLPLSIAMLITFALSPLVTRLRSVGLPMIASVLAAVTLAFAVIGLFVLVVAGQLSELARQLPTFQENIVTKLEALQDTGPENGLVARLSRMASEINAQIATRAASAGQTDCYSGPCDCRCRIHAAGAGRIARPIYPARGRK